VLDAAGGARDVRDFAEVVQAVIAEKTRDYHGGSRRIQQNGDDRVKEIG
jgi:hypothetical protein